MGTEQRFGEEFQVSPGPVSQEMLQLTYEKVKLRYPDATILKTKTIEHDDQAHWVLDCPSEGSHGHIYLTWESEPS